MRVSLCTLVVCAAFFGLPASSLAVERTPNGDEQDRLQQQDMMQSEDVRWRISLTAGVIAAPNFLGDDDYQVSAFPNVSVTYGDQFSASLDGVRYTPFSYGQMRFGGVVAYDFGRDERPDDSPFSLTNTSSADLVGLGDVDGTIEVGGFIEYELEWLSARVEVRQGIDGGHDGLIAQAELKYEGNFMNLLGLPIFYSIGPELTFADAAYNSAFFDVNAAQSAASGIAQYNASGGINSVGLHLAAFMPVTEHATLGLIAGYDQLMGDVGDSTIVSERGSKDQFTAGLFMSYTF